jgi:hypothetical protein
LDCKRPIHRNTDQASAVNIQNLVSSIKQLNGTQLTQRETAAITPPNPGKHTARAAVITILGSLAIAADVFLLLHGRGHK